jgi:hypothetical protein
MSRVLPRVPLGLVIEAVVALMLPLSFPDERAALLGAFCAQFALGFFAADVRDGGRLRESTGAHSERRQYHPLNRREHWSN